MLIYKEMDATGVNEGIIAHGVNCQHKMASGIAKTIREKFPDVYKIYMKNPKGPKMLGAAHLITISEKLHVANLYTQVFYGYGGGKYADADAIENGLRFIANLSDIMYEVPIFMPRIGCGLGGLDWDTEVEPGVSRVAAEYPNVDIVVCDLPS